MHKKLLIAILFAAALIRLINLGGGDITGSDEVFYAFRAVGMLDFDNAPQQTTPLQWQDPNVQWWTHLSFHDHPPLVFLLQHWSMGIFGENNFGFRFPSAVLGIVSVYLIYLINKRLASERAGLIAAAIAAVTVNCVYISRLGLQESCVIFFILLSSYFFLRALDEKKYFLWTGAALGLGLLAKYNVLVMVPIFISYLALFRRDVFRKKYFWIGVAISFLVFSPVIVYNIMMYRQTGHFDFQFSYIFGQDPTVWKSAPGKEAMPTLTDRVHYFFPYLFNTNSLTLLLLVLPALWVLFKKRLWFPVLAIAWMLLLLSRIGPTYRFLTMLVPFLVIAVGIFIDRIYDPLARKGPVVMPVLVALLLGWETLYSTNSLVLNYPIGPQPILFSHLRYDNYNWGYNELSDYLDGELAGKFPALTFEARYKFIEKIQDASIKLARDLGWRPSHALLIYDGNISSPAQLWIFDRLQIYHGWPVMEAGEYLSLIREKREGYLAEAGLTSRYFITPTSNIPLKTESLGGRLTESGRLLEDLLNHQIGVAPSVIVNKRGETVFRIYKF